MKKILPIFPLPLVLIPFEILPLHIFEPRYRRMLQAVEAGEKEFGVSYFDPEKMFGDRPETDGVGCVAGVRNVKRLPDGRANILTVGGLRYRLIDWIEDADEPFLFADVEIFKDEAEDADVLKPLAEDCAALYGRVVEATNRLINQPSVSLDAPHADAEILSFQMTNAVNLPPNLKYEMLASRSTVERLTRTRRPLRKIVADLEENAKTALAAKTNGHGKFNAEL